MKLIAFAFAFAVVAPAFATPEVTISSATKQSDGTYKIDYSLTGGPAIITADIATNGVAMNGICGFTGDVHKLIAEDDDYSIVWDPKVAELPAADEYKFSVKAWETNSPPDYIVIDISEKLPLQYYLSEKAIPGGLLANCTYRTTAIVMRRIHAAGITWTMGCDGAYFGESWRSYKNEKEHEVTLPHDFYIGVFPITQQQWNIIIGRIDDNGCSPLFNFPGWRWMRPVERILGNTIREQAQSITDDDNHYEKSRYPNPPYAGKFVSNLRARSGIPDFDLPGEAQWEYACRAGHAPNEWGDGTPIVRSEWIDETGLRCVGDHNLPGRYAVNGGKGQGIYAPYWTANPTNRLPIVGSPVVGSYRPNSWGLYDMNGGVREICLDYYQDDITRFTKGEVNAYEHKYGDKTALPSEWGIQPHRVVRGGGNKSTWSECCPTFRGEVKQSDFTNLEDVGIRVICYHGLDTWTPPAE